MTNALKGHAMKRGTLMVLKRFLTMALGALGLGALAAGTALGQGDGNIPAPDIFDDQITCIMNVPPATGMGATPRPTVIPMGGMTSPLDDLIDDGDERITDTVGLGYVIPAVGANCGKGPVVTDGNQVGPFNAADVVGIGTRAMPQNPGEGDIATDVAHGYTDLLDKFKAVYGDPGLATSTGTAGVLETAQKALDAAIARGSTSLTSLQNAVTRAQEAHDKVEATFRDAAGGPIYEAAVAEWMAKSLVTQSIGAYNEAVDEVIVAKTGDPAVTLANYVYGLDNLNYADYVPLENTKLIEGGGTAATNGVFTFDTEDEIDGEINFAALERYANADLSNPLVATVDEDDDTTDNINEAGRTNTTASNFDAAGNLIVPMNLFDEDGQQMDVDGVLGPVKSAAIVSAVRSRRDQTRAAAEALAELAADTRTATGGESPVQRTYDEAARRAQVEADYYDSVYNAMLGDTTNLNTGGSDDDGPVADDPDTEDLDESAPYSIASRYAAFQTADNVRFIAEQTLRGAVADREAATANVREQFTSPHSFYEQLVARRQALKVTADRAVAEASTSGRTPSETVTDAAADAAEALADAQEAQAAVAAAFGDEGDPTAALVQELLKTDGDDGQALVDAIAATYETAAGAADAAREVVDALTGEGGAVSLNTAGIATNEGNISDNSDAIAQNENDIDGNTTMIGTNAANITANATNIAANTGHIMENRGMIETNAGDIMTNAGNISMNSGRIDANEMGIASNASSIASNASMIGSNSAGISDNRAMIGELSESLEVVRAGVAASMALAGMPAINGRGISIGVGSFDGESAFAVGFQIQGEMASFKVGLTSGGGATGASAGVGFQF